jgi:hypothetical protein
MTLENSVITNIVQYVDLLSQHLGHPQPHLQTGQKNVTQRSVSFRGAFVLLMEPSLQAILPLRRLLR